MSPLARGSPARDFGSRLARGSADPSNPVSIQPHGNFEKPLPELYTYKGINPRPAILDAYRESSLEEMRAFNPKVELRPKTPRRSPRAWAESLDLRSTGAGGARIYPNIPPAPQGSGPASGLLEVPRIHGKRRRLEREA